MKRNGFTKVEQRMLEVLSDGLPHSRKELHACLYDELSRISSIRYHLSNIRKKLPDGETVICEYVGTTFKYRHIRLLKPAHTSAKRLATNP